MRIYFRLNGDLLAAVGDVSRSISIVRAPLLVALIGALVFWYPDQTIEIYRGTALDLATNISQVIIAFVGLLVTSYAILRMALSLATVSGKAIQSRAGRYTLIAMPSICGVLLPLSIACALRSSSVSIEPLGPQISNTPEYMSYTSAMGPLNYRLWFGSVICVSIGLIVLLCGIWAAFKSKESETFSPWGILGPYAGIFFVALTGSTVFVITTTNGNLPATIGVGAIIMLFLLCLAFFTSIFTLCYFWYRIPLLTLLFILAILFSVADLTDNHVVRILPRAAKQLLPVKYSFTDWYNERRDRNRFEKGGEPYPVFLISAAGGGLYAAYYTAEVLARLQDRCPNFAQHVFAISGVSGGSLGAAVFSSLAKDFASNGPPEFCGFERHRAVGPFERRTKAVLSRDFLAPLMAGGLFPDFLQRFVPHQGIDRAQIFNSSLIKAWHDGVPDGPNHFAEPFLDLWQPQSASPALILNTTHVAGGFRVPIVPFLIGARTELEYEDVKITGVEEFHLLLAGGVDAEPGPFKEVASDIDLATAVGISARFPWIEPAASVPVQLSRRVWLDSSESRTEKTAPQNIRLVDGGYYDNSGMDTLQSLLLHIKGKEVKGQSTGSQDSLPNVRFYVISIGAFSSTKSEAPWQGISELLSPIRAMLNTREQRGVDAFFRGWTNDVACYEAYGCELNTPKWFLLDQNDFQLPLGWQLSSATRSVIDLQAGDPTFSDPRFVADFTIDRPSTRIGTFWTTANNTACEIVQILHPIKLENSECKSDRGVAFATRRYDEAIAQYSSIILYNPKSAGAYISRGDAYENKGDYLSAVADYTKAIELDPKADEAFALRGRVRLHEGEYDLVVSDESRAIEINSYHVKYYEYRADAYVNKGQFDKAIADYTKIIDYSSLPLMEWYAKRASAFIGKGDYDGAIRDYTELIDTAPWEVKYYLMRGNVYKAKGDAAQAKIDFDMAKKLAKEPSQQ
jgi:predicted negative regulator of RcsB-dependent stress response